MCGLRWQVVFALTGNKARCETNERLLEGKVGNCSCCSCCFAANDTACDDDSGGEDHDHDHDDYALLRDAR